MLIKEMQDALNKQINAEFWSAYLYLSMSAWFSSRNLPGFANWMYIQFKEEQEHGLKIFQYVHERGGTVTLKPVAETPYSWKSPSDVFKCTLEHEEKVTSMFNDLMDTAVALKDYASQNFLAWFINEQIEEEATASDILHALLDIEAKPAVLRMMDKEMGARKDV